MRRRWNCGREHSFVWSDLHVGKIASAELRVTLVERIPELGICTVARAPLPIGLWQGAWRIRISFWGRSIELVCLGVFAAIFRWGRGGRKGGVLGR